MRGTFLLVLALFAAVTFLPLRAETRAVDVALVLAIDISASVSADEHSLQMAGLAAALQSPEVREAIQSGPHQRIAITVTQWSGLACRGWWCRGPSWTAMRPRASLLSGSWPHLAPIRVVARPSRWHSNMRPACSIPRRLPPAVSSTFQPTASTTSGRLWSASAARSSARKSPSTVSPSPATGRACRTTSTRMSSRAIRL